MIHRTKNLKRTKGSSVNDVTVVMGRGYQGFCDNNTKASVIKSVTIGGGEVKNVTSNCVTSFMDDPLNAINKSSLKALL